MLHFEKRLVGSYACLKQFKRLGHEGLVFRAASENYWLVLAEPIDCDCDGGVDGHCSPVFFSA